MHGLVRSMGGGGGVDRVGNGTLAGSTCIGDGGRMAGAGAGVKGASAGTGARGASAGTGACASGGCKRKFEGPES
jgi:hypothetical protein